MSLWSFFFVRQKNLDAPILDLPKKKQTKLTKPKSIRKKKYKRNDQNPMWGRVASTILDYKIHDNKTQIDMFVARLRRELKIPSETKIAVSGLRGLTRREKVKNTERSFNKRYSRTYGELFLIKKFYKVGIIFDRSFFQIDSNSFIYDPETHYTNSILNPLSDLVKEKLQQNVYIDQNTDDIRAGLKSNGQISIWIHLWLEISAVDISKHLIRFQKNILSQNNDLTISELNNVFKLKPGIMEKCYEDYSILNSVFQSVEKQVFSKLGIDPIKWKNQELLFSLVKKKFNNARSEYSPSWLERQRFDIYIPSKKTAIEYQGLQHYQAVDFFGGEEGYRKNTERDMKKINLAAENNVKLIFWPYWIKITNSNFQKFCKDNSL